MTKTDRGSGMEVVRKNASEQYQDFVCAVRDASRVNIETPNALDVDVSCFPADTLRALLTRAEEAEARLAILDADQSLTVAYLAGAKDGKADAWDEAIEAAASAAKGQYNDTPMHDPESPFFGSDMSPDRSDWGRGIQRGRSQAASTIRAIPNPYRKDKTDDQ